MIGWLTITVISNARRIFSMVVGPGIDQNLVVGSESNPIGDISDIVLTMAEVLGIKVDKLFRQGLPHQVNRYWIGYDILRNIIDYHWDALGILCTLIHCQGDNLPPNPYDAIQDLDDLSTDSIPLASLEGLQTKVFAPTCANSGCHDGTFEPDFRTAEASYNRLVYQPIIKNYVSNPLSYRALPFDANNSMILRRLQEDIDGISGIMPLATEPDSDWEIQQRKLHRSVRRMDQPGCPDMFGNVVQATDFIPQLKGFQITATGSTVPFPRSENYAIQVPSSTASIDLWFCLE